MKNIIMEGFMSEVFIEGTIEHVDDVKGAALN